MIFYDGHAEGWVSDENAAFFLDYTPGDNTNGEYDKEYRTFEEFLVDFPHARPYSMGDVLHKMSRETIEVFLASKTFEETVLSCFDNGCAGGLAPEFMLEDIKKEVTGSELGSMNYTLDCIMQQWKDDRGL
jgi:hypothetical protein